MSLKTSTIKSKSILRRIEIYLKNSEIKHTTMLMENKKKLNDIITHNAEISVWKKIIETVFYIPFLRSYILSKLNKKIDENKSLHKKTISKIEKYNNTLSITSSSLKKIQLAYKKQEEYLQDFEKLIRHSRDIEVESTIVISQLRSIANTTLNDSSIQEILRIIQNNINLQDKHYAQHTTEYINQKKKKNSEQKIKQHPIHKIFLPIPRNSFKHALTIGAKFDDSQNAVFVTTDMNLKTFKNLLPLAYRQNPTTFTFPPIPYNAKGQNLWSIFDKHSWNHIKNAAYDTTGKRCIICGKTGGWFSNKIFSASENRSVVDCHEIWEWDVPNENNGIGIQKLQRLLVVCPDCHMMFHDGYAKHRASEVNLEQAATEFLDKRKMLINRMTQEQINFSTEQSKEKLKSLKNIDTWIMDLSLLGNQQFMLDNIPQISNSPPIPASNISGITFEDVNGISYDKKSTSEIYAEVLASFKSDDIYTYKPK